MLTDIIYIMCVGVCVCVCVCVYVCCKHCVCVCVYVYVCHSVCAVSIVCVLLQEAHLQATNNGPTGISFGAVV